MNAGVGRLARDEAGRRREAEGAAGTAELLTGEEGAGGLLDVDADDVAGIRVEGEALDLWAWIDGADVGRAGPDDDDLDRADRRRTRPRQCGGDDG